MSKVPISPSEGGCLKRDLSETFPNPWKRGLSKVSLMLKALLNEKRMGNMNTIMCNFIVYISTCDWLISKFVSNFCLCGLGSFGRTVSISFLSFYLFQCIWRKCIKKKSHPNLWSVSYATLPKIQKYWRR